MPADGSPLAPTAFSRRHRRPMIVLRALLAPWILAVVVVLCALGHWWGLVFLVALAADLWLLRRLLQSPDAPGLSVVLMRPTQARLEI